MNNSWNNSDVCIVTDGLMVSTHLVDVEGAFLNGIFEHSSKHKLYIEILEAYRQWYPSWAVFLLLKTQYGIVQAALQYYREHCRTLAFLKFKRNPVEPGLMDR